MLFTSILITITISLLLYIILYSQINKIKKEYVKKDLTEEMKDIITAFTEEADKNITILENLVKQADDRIKKIKKYSVKSYDQNRKSIELNNDINEKILNEEAGYQNNKKNNDKENIKNNMDRNNNEKSKIIDNSKKIEDSEDLPKLNLGWEEKAYRMYENGFNIEEISNKLQKSIAEINFALKYIKLKKRLK